MLTTGIVLLVAGFVLSLGAFVFAALSMGGYAKGMFSSEAEAMAPQVERGRPRNPGRFSESGLLSSFGKLFAKFTGAIVVMAVGGALAALGLVLVVVALVQQSGVV